MSQDAGDEASAGPAAGGDPVESDGGFPQRGDAPLGGQTVASGSDGYDYGTEEDMLPTSPTRPLYVYLGSVVAVFVAAGIGLGLGSNFILGFLIEQFVEPGTTPTDNTIISIMLLHNVITPFLVGPLIAVAAGAFVGRALPGRTLTAAFVAGFASLVGFYLMTGLTLFLTIDVLSQYGAGGGGGGALDRAALGRQVVESGIPAAMVGAIGGYLGAFLTD
jgi:hypothetical protein